MNQVPAWLGGRSVTSGFVTNDFLSGIGSSLPAHLSIANNRFTLVDAAGNERQPSMEIDICIIAANPHASRIYYDPASPFDPSGANNTPPLCWSDNGTGPSRNAAQPQSPTCAACPNSVWGSAQSRLTGRGIPACQQSKKVAFLVPGDADDILYMFKVPPASLKNLAQYVQTLAGNKISGRPVMPSDVITRVQFASQGVVTFTPIGLVDEDSFNRTERYCAQPAAINQTTGRDDVAIDPQAMLGHHQPVVSPAKQPTTASRTDLKFMPPGETVATRAKPRGRPAAVKKVEEKGSDALDIPPFLDATKRVPASSPKNEAGPGMVDAPAPSSEISDALNNAFNLPGV